MAFVSLSSRLAAGQIELILCGPILRRCEPTSATVWLALREKRTVTLSVLDPNGAVVMTGSREAVTLGPALHLVAVTARATGAPAVEGVVYRYDLDLGSGQRLATPGVLHHAADPNNPIASIAYPGHDLPSFALPPSDLAALRILHGSCRKPHADSQDALPAADDILITTVHDPLHRPHALFFGGDQIYADDVADPLLHALRDAAHALLGSTGAPYVEELPDFATPLLLQPGCRAPLIRNQARLTADDDAIPSHLIELGEYLAMYLFVWSDTLWPALPSALPRYDEAFPERAGDKAYKAARKRWDGFLPALGWFADSIVKVRRALANVPTYMICDDHEVTDDWYMTRAFVRKVLGKGNVLGRRILRNGIAAYAACQAWGNTPEQFVAGANGGDLLDALATWCAAQRGQASAGEAAAADARIQAALSLPTPDDVEAEGPLVLAHLAKSIDFHYSVVGPRHVVVVTDTRTWRSFPGKDDDPPDLLSDANGGLARQLDAAPKPPADGMTLVLLTTNLCSIPALLTATEALHEVYEFDMGDAWEMHSRPFVALLKRLSTRADQVGGKGVGRFAILSGDIHFSYCWRIRHRTTAGGASGPDVDSVFAGLTASSFHNEAGKTRALHQLGNVGAERHRYFSFHDLQPEHEFALQRANFLFRRQDRGGQVWENSDDVFPDTGLLPVRPDSFYLIDWLKSDDVPRAPVPFAPTSIGPPPGDRASALKSYLATASNHRQYANAWGNGREIVGVSNLGEITFRPGPPFTIVHELWWQCFVQGSSALSGYFPLSRFSLSLEPEELPAQLKLAGEP